MAQAHTRPSSANLSSMAPDGERPSSPPKHSSPRVGHPRSFLPLDEEYGLSTRGQHLSQIISRRSTTNVTDLVSSPGRRPSYSASEWHANNVAAYVENAGDDDEHAVPPSPRRESVFSSWGGGDREQKRGSLGLGFGPLMTPQMRSQRLIGSSNPRYNWEQYYKKEEELKKMKKPIRKYYERNNRLIQQYLYIDRLLDSSLPHSLIQEYHQHLGQLNGTGADQSTPTIPATITEENLPLSPTPDPTNGSALASPIHGGVKVKRTPKNLYKLQDEETPLLANDRDVEADSEVPTWEPDEDEDSNASIVTLAIYINLAANTILLLMKIVVTVLTSSISVLASLVDAALDFLSTAIVWTTTRLISRLDQYAYPIGRRKLEPIGVLVFSVIMVTSFVQVALEGIGRISSGDHSIIQLTIPAIAIMASTVVVKFLCWLWCRLIRNSSVQALAQDAMTDVVFNIFSIIFPLIGYTAKIWWLDPLGGIVLSLYVIFAWSRTSSTHIRNLTGAAGSADQRNVLLYLTMRFARTIKQIQGCQAYHAGDKLIVEVDVVLDADMTLRDSHDLGESLQYVLESVPFVDRAFVHLDYAGWNLPTHMQQQE